MEDQVGNAPGAVDTNAADNASVSTENAIANANDAANALVEEHNVQPAVAEVVVPQIDKMIQATNEFLKRHNAEGIDGEIGNYDQELIKDACQKILNGSVHANTGYGIIMSRLYYETANLI